MSTLVIKRPMVVSTPLLRYPHLNSDRHWSSFKFSCSFPTLITAIDSGMSGRTYDRTRCNIQAAGSSCSYFQVLKRKCCSAPNYFEEHQLLIIRIGSLKKHQPSFWLKILYITPSVAGILRSNSPKRTQIVRGLKEEVLMMAIFTRCSPHFWGIPTCSQNINIRGPSVHAFGFGT